MSLNYILSVILYVIYLKEMGNIWYILKCPNGYEKRYIQICQKLVEKKELKEVICFEYQQLMRYGGSWHLVTRNLLPGCIFLSGIKVMELKENSLSLLPCSRPYLKELCQDGNMIGMSKGIINKGNTIIISGPLKGRERLIRKIDRHKRTARIEIPFTGESILVTVGLEIYEKE